MAQRYAALRKSTSGDDRIHYCRANSLLQATISNICIGVANPGSILWLTEDRPLPDSDCEGFDEYKYGLNGSFPAYALGDANNLGRDGLVERYRSRNLHYAWGLVSQGNSIARNTVLTSLQNDYGNGDTRCQAEVCDSLVSFMATSNTAFSHTDSRGNPSRARTELCCDA